MMKRTLKDILDNPEQFELVDVFENDETGEVTIEHRPLGEPVSLVGFLVRQKDGT